MSFADMKKRSKTDLSSLIKEDNDLDLPNNPLKEAGNILTSKRKELGINRYDLARRTLITPYVIEAIENGWTNKLPEKTYLSSMLERLEQELNIPNNKLTNLIKEERSIKYNKRGDFVPNIDIFYSWKGNIAYIFLMLLILFLLNYVHQKAILMNGISLVEITEDKCIDKSKKLL